MDQRWNSDCTLLRSSSLMPTSRPTCRSNMHLLSCAASSAVAASSSVCKADAEAWATCSALVWWLLNCFASTFVCSSRMAAWADRWVTCSCKSSWSCTALLRLGVEGLLPGERRRRFESLLLLSVVAAQLLHNLHDIIKRPCATNGLGGGAQQDRRAVLRPNAVWHKALVQGALLHWREVSVTVSLGISCVYGLALGYCGVYSWQRLCPGLYASPGCFRRQGGH